MGENTKTIARYRVGGLGALLEGNQKRSDKIALFDLIDNDLLHNLGIPGIYRNIGLLFATAFVFDQPIEDIPELFVLLVFEERVVLERILSLF